MRAEHEGEDSKQREGDNRPWSQRIGHRIMYLQCNSDPTWKLGLLQEA